MSVMQGPPRRILLATDLSARCDRALDRAAALAREWQAELFAVHVLEQRDEFYELERYLPSWRHSANLAPKVEAQLRRDMAQAATNGTVIVETGEPTEVILQNALERQSDLIVIGLARDEPSNRVGLGTTIDHLLSRTRTPLLIVRQKPRAAYANIVVATDLSDSSLHGLYAASTFFPDRKLAIFYAFDGHMAEPAYLERDREAARTECIEFVDAARNSAGISREQWPQFEFIVEYGHPSYLIRQYVLDTDVDLVALSTHGRSALFNVLIGSTAKEIISGLSCDALVVREPRASIEGEAAS